MNGWVLLGVAIVLEVGATTLLKLSNGFSRPIYAAGSMLLYWGCFWLLAMVLTRIPIGVAYADQVRRRHCRDRAHRPSLLPPAADSGAGRLHGADPDRRDRPQPVDPGAHGVSFHRRRDPVTLAS